MFLKVGGEYSFGATMLLLAEPVREGDTVTQASLFNDGEVRVRALDPSDCRSHIDRSDEARLSVEVARDREHAREVAAEKVVEDGDRAAVSHSRTQQQNRQASPSRAMVIRITRR